MSSSIKDVARVAGVSVATVSRALSGAAAVSPALTERIQHAIRETGYRPNLSARRLRSQDSGTIGLIVADIRNPFIAGVFGNASSSGVERHDGYVAAMFRLGLPPRSTFVPPQALAAEEAVAHWLRETARPDALIASNGLLLMGLVRAVRHAGLQIARDIAVAGFDNESWTEIVEPGLTVIEQPVDDIGRNAMQLLSERLKNPDLPARKLLLSGRCIERGSTRCGGAAA